METLEMTARQILRPWEVLRLEWLLCPLNLRNEKRGLTKGNEWLTEAAAPPAVSNVSEAPVTSHLSNISI